MAAVGPTRAPETNSGLAAPLSRFFCVVGVTTGTLAASLMIGWALGGRDLASALGAFFLSVLFGVVAGVAIGLLLVRRAAPARARWTGAAGLALAAAMALVAFAVIRLGWASW